MNGWRIVGVATLLLLVAFGAVVSIYGTEQAGLETLVRATARLSFLLFLPVYVASPARRLWKNGATRWLLANRRYLGVSFFVAHALHLDAIILLSILMGDAFQVDVVTLVGGGLAYVLVFAMAATSFDRMVAWLGPKRWKRLHRFGIHYLAFIWFLQWTPLALFESIAYAPMVLLMVAAFGIRFAGRRSRQTRGVPAAATT